METPTRSRPTSWGWLPLLTAGLMVVVGFVMNVGLVDGILEKGDLAGYDPAVTTAAIGRRSSVLTPLARILTFAGSTMWLAGLIVVVVLALCVARHWRAAVVVAGTMAVSVVATILLKRFVGRARPSIDDMIGTIERGYAFPSGHTLNATVAYGLLAGMALLRARTWAWRVAIGVAWLLLTFGVGLSRIYLGFHWMTDVIGGWFSGVAILGLALAVWRLIPSRLPTD